MKAIEYKYMRIVRSTICIETLVDCIFFFQNDSNIGTGKEQASKHARCEIAKKNVAALNISFSIAFTEIPLTTDRPFSLQLVDDFL